MGNPNAVQATENSLDNASLRAAEAATGVHIVTRGVMPWTSAEEFNIMIASGEYTDLVFQFASLYTAGEDNAIEEGIIYDLAPMMETCAPDFLREISQFEDGIKAITTDGGHMPEIGNITIHELKPDQGLFIRQDWLDGLGMDTPVTYDDLHDALVGFQSEYGSRGMLMMNTGVFCNNYLAAGYGINAYQVVGFLSEYAYYQVDGEVRHGWAQPEFKDYLTMMSEWYAEGLIHPDTLLMSADWMNPDNETYINTGEVGLWFKSQSGITALEEANVDANCDIVALADPVLQPGDTIHTRTTAATRYGLGGGMVITTACADPELALKWLNFFFTEEGALIANYGEEGTTYTMVDGAPQYTDMIIQGEGGAFMAWNVNCLSCAPFLNDNTKLDVVYSEKELAAPDIWMSNADYAYMYPVAAVLNEEEGTEFNNLMSEINTYASENIIRFIIGELSMDEFDAFVNQMNEMGLPRCTELKQAALDRYMSR